MERLIINMDGRSVWGHPGRVPSSEIPLYQLDENDVCLTLDVITFPPSCNGYKGTDFLVLAPSGVIGWIGCVPENNILCVG